MNADDKPNTEHDVLQFTCTYQFSDMRELASALIWRNRIVRVVGVVFLFVGIALILANPTNIVLWLEFIGLAVLLAAFPSLHAWVGWRAQRARMGTVQHIRINAEGLHLSNEYGDTHFQWTGMRSLDETKNLYLVRMNGTTSRLLLPKRALDMHQQGRLREYVRQRIDAARDGSLGAT